MAKHKVVPVVPQVKNCWFIKQAPEHFADCRKDLRIIRKQLNKAAGVDEDTEEFSLLPTAEQNSKRIYTMTMGPDNVHYRKAMD